MPKLAVTVTDEMEAALIREAKGRAAPVASVIREAIREFLEKRGVKVDTNVEWGGNRRSDDQLSNR